MIISTRTRALMASAAASALLLTACGGSAAEETPAPSPTVEVSETTEPTPEESPVTEESPTPEESNVAEESPAPETGSTREPVTTGPLEGEELNAAGVAWFGAFCSGVAKATSFAGPDTADMKMDEITQTVVTTYQNIGGSFTATGTELAALDTAMNFENADGFAMASTSAVDEVGALYTQGSETVAAGSYATEAELLKVVNATEASVVSAGGGDFGLSNLDDTVLASVGAQVPACAEL